MKDLAAVADLELLRNPSLTDALVQGLVDVWVEVTNAGGAVGLTPPVEPDDVRPLAESHLARVRDGRDDLVVATDAGGIVVGFGFLVTAEPAVVAHRGTVMRLQRRPGSAGQGVGAAILADLEALARARGLRVTTLTVRDGTGTEAFYVTQGYRLDATLADRLLIDGRLTAEHHLSKRLDAEPSRAGSAPMLRVQRLDRDLPLPARANPGDAGLDLHAREPVTLHPGERALVPTGLAIALPPGTVGLLHPRSGLALRHGVGMVNAPGTIDEGYRGELKVILVNLDPRETVTLQRGDRVAQLVIQPVEQPPVVEVDAVGESPRGAGGFGSSGR